ncbi:MAG TPA: hypothetical protein ENN84_04580 [Candidatus Marinimicrobia bacterium]|nr:hypothetical protein [Candidatus Neomarinimicrobiota bacterium]
MWWNLSHPIKAVETYGVSEFFHREFGNLSTSFNKAQFMPNIGIHTIGNGMKYVKLSEYYHYHGVKFPKIKAIGFTFSYHLMNEILENGTYDKVNVDPISDLYIFNPLGILLFSIPGFQKFWAETLHLSDWSLQPMFNPLTGTIENCGDQFMIRYFRGKKQNWALFSYYGVDNIFGFSLPVSWREGGNISIGAGACVNRLHESREEIARIMLPELDYEMGFFYDINQSLMSSLIITGPRYFNVRLNIYPGLIHFRNLQPSFYIAAGESDGFILGINLKRYASGLHYNFHR